jgi:hypothetical protein
MGRVHMVPLVTATSSFEAKLLAARLGSEGILWELRGAVDGPYPVGVIEVLVAADDEADARELLLVDEVEDALDPADTGTTRGSSWWALAVGVLMVAFAVLRVVGAGVS